MTSGGQALRDWLRATCAAHTFDLRGLLRGSGSLEWPLAANDAADLEAQLLESGHLVPLPSESAALANLLEVALVDVLVDAAKELAGVVTTRGTARGYPDLEISGGDFGGFHAVDVKVARRKLLKRSGPTQLQNRIALYTGNTYFRYPELHLSGSFRRYDLKLWIGQPLEGATYLPR